MSEWFILVPSSSVKAMNWFEFYLGEKKCRFVVLSVTSGRFQKPAEDSKLL